MKAFIEQWRLEIGATAEVQRVELPEFSSQIVLIKAAFFPAPAYIAFGDSLVTATGDDMPLYPGDCIAVHLSAEETHFSYVALLHSRMWLVGGKFE